ncbi:MAG: glycosyltransferase family 4 protein [Thermoanaerobaculia bacterium]
MTVILSCVVAAAVCRGLLTAMGRQRAVRLPMDLPSPRGSHERPTPRVGGMAIVAGVLAGVGVLTLAGQQLDGAAWLVLGCSLSVATVGLVDDLRGLGVAPRLLVQGVAAAVVVACLGGVGNLPLPPPADLRFGPAAAWAFSLLWLVGVTNFFNFMDGIDGLAGGQALITCSTLAVVSWGSGDGRLSLLVAAPVLVFLLSNWSPARVFLGDMGSFFLGFFLAASPWIGRQDLREERLLVVATSLALFLLDPVWTLLRRFARGARLTQAHREHLYQRLTAPPRSHAVVAAGSHAAAIVLSILAVVGFRYAAWAWVAPGAALAAFSVELLLVGRSSAPADRARSSSSAPR